MLSILLPILDPNQPDQAGMRPGHDGNVGVLKSLNADSEGMGLTNLLLRLRTSYLPTGSVLLAAYLLPSHRGG